MSVNAIGSYSYSSAVQYQYFGTTISDDQIKLLLQKYNIVQTGDSYVDLQALYGAMYSDAQSEATAELQANSNPQGASQATEAANSTNVPWASLMNQVGLTATGNLDEDYSNFNNKISSMQSSGALSQQDQATINQLVSEASIVFVQQNNPTSQSQSTAQNPSGADIQALMNKMYFLG